MKDFFKSIIAITALLITGALAIAANLVAIVFIVKLIKWAWIG
jgi:hypothetical protein